MDSVHNSMLVNALERALNLADQQAVTLTWSDKNQNKKKEKNRIEGELAGLRLLLNFAKHNPANGVIVHKDETGNYRGRHELFREIKLDWRERFSALVGNIVKLRVVLLTEGVIGRRIEAVSVTVGTDERDIMKKEEAKQEEEEKEDTLEKVVESEPLEKQLKENGTDTKEGSESGEPDKE